nr:hypothetical protein [Tanacetum cinerariifolium]
MAFISSAKNSSGNGEVNTASIPTASTQVSPASANVAAASISLDTACAYIVSQSNGSQIKYEDINQIDGDDIEEMDIKAPRSQDRGRRENYRQGSKEEEQGPKDTVLSPPPAQVYSPPKKDMSWTGLPEFTDDTITDYIRKFPTGNSKVSTTDLGNKGKAGNSQNNIDDKGYWDSGCSWHMTGNISYLSDYEPFDEGYVSFGQGGCKITGKGTIKTDESMLWHRRLGHLNFKTMNRLVRHNLVKGLPFKCFDNDHTCVAYLKGKQHKASCKTKLVNSVSKPLHTLHMDLFGPTSDETSGILRNFITEIENLKDLKVKIIRCDNGGEFRNKVMNDFCSGKGIKREFSNARTPQRNGVAERRNRTLIKAARTILVDAMLPVTIWAKAVNTACYVQNRVLNKLIEKGAGPNWLFDIDTLTNSMNYVPVVSAGTTSTNFLGTKDAASQNVKKDVSSLRYISLPNWFHEAHLESSTSNAQDACKADAPERSGNSNLTATSTNPPADQMETLTVETPIPTVSSPVSTACLDDSP